MSSTRLRRLRHAGRRPSAASVAEPLESRRLLTITITGTSAADTIVVNRNGSDVLVTLNGTDTTYSIGSNIDIVVNGLGGSDSINLYELQNLIGYVNAGSGDDTVRIGGGDYDNHFDNPVFIDGGTGSDVLIIDDVDDVGADDYRFTWDTTGNALGTFFQKVNDTNSEVHVENNFTRITLLCNDEDNEILIQDRTQMGVALFDIQGRGGIDLLEFQCVDGAASVDFDGGSGVDRLSYTDTLDAPAAVNLLANSLEVDGVTVATWASNQEVQVNVNGGDDIYSVSEVGTNIAVTVNPGAGDDLINVGNNDIDANIRGPLHISNFVGQGFNRLALLDAAGTTPDVYSLTGTSMAKTGLAFPIVFFADEHTLNANGGNNAITLASPAFLDTWIINAGAGDDTLTYGSGDLRGRPATLSGGTGADVLILNDTDPVSALITDKDYTFTGGGLTHRANNSSGNDTLLNWSSWANVTLNAGSHNSTFTVDSLSGVTALNINPGAGNDDLFMPKLNFPSTTFNYANSGGFDTVRIDDSADAFTADAYTTGAGTFDKTGFGILMFSAIAQMTIQGSPTANTFDVLGLSVPTTITGGSGSDTFTVGAGDIEDQILTNLLVQGNQGGDRLILNDAADTDNNSYAFTAGSFTKGSMLGRAISHNTVEFIELNASPGSDTITASAFGFPLAVTLRGAAGADTFDITPGSTIVTVEGSDPTVSPGDVLVFSNAQAAGTASFTPNGAVNGTFGFTSAQPVTFFGIETFPTVPPAAATPDLAAASDTGLSSTDNITNDNTPTFTGAQSGSIWIDLWFGPSLVASGLAASGNWSITAPVQPDGTYAVTARLRNVTSGLTGAASGVLIVTIDTVAPAPPTVPDMTAASDTGISSTDNITRDNTPTFTGSAETGARVDLLRPPTGPLFGDGTAADGKYTVTTNALPNGNLSIAARATDVAGNVSAVSAALSVTIDTVAPQVSSSTFFFETSHAIAYVFSESVSATLGVADLLLQNVTQATTIPPGSIALAADTFTFPGLANGVLPDGNYQATLSAAGVTDVAGNALASDHLLDFFVLAGDANRDRRVNISDFSIVASRFNLPGIFSQGDFNYSGTVEIGDFSILASKFNTGLPAARAAVQWIALPGLANAEGARRGGAAPSGSRVADAVLFGGRAIRGVGTALTDEPADGAGWNLQRRGRLL